MMYGYSVQYYCHCQHHHYWSLVAVLRGYFHLSTVCHYSGTAAAGIDYVLPLLHCSAGHRDILIDEDYFCRIYKHSCHYSSVLSHNFVNIWYIYVLISNIYASLEWNSFPCSLDRIEHYTPAYYINNRFLVCCQIYFYHLCLDNLLLLCCC